MTGRDATRTADADLAELAALTFDFGNTLVRVDRAALRRAVQLTAERIADRLAIDRDVFLAGWAEERDRQFAEEVPEFREVDLEQRSVRVLARLRGVLRDMDRHVTAIHLGGRHD